MGSTTAMVYCHIC